MEDIKSQWGIKDSVDIDVKSMKMAPWGTQVAVVVLPANGVPREERERRLKTGLTIASVRQLTNVQRCYRCHMLGHMAAKCTVVCPGKELCRRCGSAEHIIKACEKEPKCAMCSRYELINVRHITGSLACPMVRQGFKNTRRGLNKGPTSKLK